MTNEIEVMDEVSNDALTAITRAEIDMQISTAKKYPRVLSKVKQDMLSFATLDEETAQSCFYSLPRGGKTIQGESVRLAEIAISCYGNIMAGARPIQTVTKGDHPHVIVQAVVHDLEKNVRISMEKRRRITKKKSKEFVDEDDINLAVNACAAIAFRDAVFKVIPKAIIRPVFLEAKRVAIGDVKSLAVKRDKVIDRLKAMGISEERIFAAVEARKLDDIDLEKLEVLIGLGTALKDGATTTEEAFPMPQPKLVTSQPAPATPAKTEKAGSSKHAINELLKADNITIESFTAWAVTTGQIEAGKTIDDIAETKLAAIVKTWAQIKPQIQIS